MPKLSDTLASQPPAGMVAVAPTSTPNPSAPHVPQQDPQGPMNQNTFMRCPLPPIWSANPDSLRQFYVGGKVPQFRIYAPSLVTIK